jgi:hypothetical protein
MGWRATHHRIKRTIPDKNPIEVIITKTQKILIDSILVVSNAIRKAAAIEIAPMPKLRKRDCPAPCPSLVNSSSDTRWTLRSAALPY